MANGENHSNGNGNRAGNLQLNANTGVTIGLVLTILGVSAAAIYKAGEVVTDLGYVKRDLGVLTTDIAEMKRLIQQMNRQQSGTIAK